MVMSSNKWNDAKRLTLSRLNIRAECESLDVKFAASSPNNDGRLTCHAVDRDDANPSAGVNVAGENGQLGAYHDFASPKSR